MRESSASLPQPADRYFRALIENTADIVIVLDGHGRVCYQSPTAESIVGYPPEKTLGKSGFDFVHPDDLPLVLDRFAKTAEMPDMTPELAVRIRQSNGTWRTLDVVARNLLHDDVVAGILINCRDTTCSRLRTETGFSYMQPVRQSQDQHLSHNVEGGDLKSFREQLVSNPSQPQAVSSPLFVGQTKVIRELLDQAQIVAGSTSTVLLQGESGTGKELLARVIHAQSRHNAGPFVPVDCSALSEEFWGRELFDHRIRSASPASPAQTGLLAAAHGGTLFLDDIEKMPPRLQAWLSRFLEDRPGGVRVIAATQQDLKQAVDEGRFRKDLYYSVAVVRLRVPPLSHRRKDIPLLAEYFSQHYCEQAKVEKKRIPQRMMQLLLHTPWPGNVSELRATMERLVLFNPGPEIHPESLQPELPEQISEDATVPHEGDRARATLERIERNKLGKALLQAGNNRTAAAKLLGISRASFYVKAKRYGLFLQKE